MKWWGWLLVVLGMLALVAVGYFVWRAWKAETEATATAESIAESKKRRDSARRKADAGIEGYYGGTIAGSKSDADTEWGVR